MARRALADQAPALREACWDERVEFPLKTVGEFIGRVAEDQVEPPARAPQIAQRVGADDVGAGLQTEVAHVALRQRRVDVDQRGAAGPPGEGLDAERTGAAEQIEDAGAVNLPEDR